MKKFELISFETDLELATAAADDWLNSVEVANRHNQPQFVALSGGRIARQFFNAVAESSRARNVPLSRVHFFWADERCVPPDDPECNFALADKLLFQPFNISIRQIHRLHGEETPQTAAQFAATEICQFTPQNASGLPELDIVFLGMGEDGHIASLFPNASQKQILSTDVYQTVVASKPPPKRLTLSFAVIAAAREVCVLASGIGKEQALHASLTTRDSTPLARLLQMRRQTKIFTNIGLEL